MRRFSPEVPWRLPITPFPVPAARSHPSDPAEAVVVRISAQLYNEREDYAVLARALTRRLGTARVDRTD